MKKFYFLLLVFLYAIPVKAMDKNYLYTQKYSGKICDNEKHYQMYRVSYYSKYYYFLTLDDNYSLNFEDYQKIDLALLPTQKDVLNITGLMQIIGDDYEKYDVPRHISRLLFEYLYPEKKLSYCSNFGFKDFDFPEERFEPILSMAKSVVQAHLFNEEIVFKETENFLFQHEHLKYFDLVDNDGLNVASTEEGLKLNGKSGIYHLQFKRKNNGFEEHELYTDGTNYLVSNGAFTDDIFELKVRVEPLMVTFETSTQGKEVCFDIYQNDILVKQGCFNHVGITSLELPQGEYLIKQSNYLDELILISNPEVSISGDCQVLLTFEEKKNLIIDPDIKKEEVEKEEITMPPSLDLGTTTEIDNKKEEISENVLPPNTTFDNKRLKVISWLWLLLIVGTLKLSKMYKK